MTLATSSPQPRLLILLNEVDPAKPESILVALRYAVTAAAMDVAVELHAIGSSAALLRHGAASLLVAGMAPGARFMNFKEPLFLDLETANQNKTC